MPNDTDKTNGMDAAIKKKYDDYVALFHGRREGKGIATYEQYQSIQDILMHDRLEAEKSKREAQGQQQQAAQPPAQPAQGPKK